MASDTQFTVFWGQKLPPDTLVEVEVDEHPGISDILHVTQLALGPNPSNKPHPIMLQVEDKQIYIGTLKKDVCFHLSLDLPMPSTFKIMNTGDTDVYASGYHVAIAEGSITSDDEDEEEEEEDVQEPAAAKPAVKAIKAAPQANGIAVPDLSDDDLIGEIDDGEDDEDEDESEDESEDEDESDWEMGELKDVGMDIEADEDDEDEDVSDDEDDEDEDEEEEAPAPAQPLQVGKKRVEAPTAVPAQGNKKAKSAAATPVKPSEAAKSDKKDGAKEKKDSGKGKKEGAKPVEAKEKKDGAKATPKPDKKEAAKVANTPKSEKKDTAKPKETPKAGATPKTPSTPKVDGPDADAYEKDIVAVLKDKKVVDLSAIGSGVKKPASLTVKLGQFIKSRPHVFKLDPSTNKVSLA